MIVPDRYLYGGPEHIMYKRIDADQIKEKKEEKQKCLLDR
jgi:hypothetical protein